MAVQLISGPLRTERLSDGRRLLLRELIVDVDNKRYVVPKGFITDYSSIPLIFGWLVRWSKVDIAGVLHDYLYTVQNLTRSEADKIWREVAKAGDHAANSFQSWTGWLGLRIGGWFAWNKQHEKA